jgi:hypothetical protein
VGWPVLLPTRRAHYEREIDFSIFDECALIEGAPSFAGVGLNFLSMAPVNILNQ